MTQICDQFSDLRHARMRERKERERSEKTESVRVWGYRKRLGMREREKLNG